MTNISVTSLRTALVLALTFGAAVGAAAGCSDDDSGKPSAANNQTSEDGGNTTPGSDGGGTTTNNDAATNPQDSSTVPTETKTGFISVVSTGSTHSVLATFLTSTSTTTTSDGCTRRTEGACNVTKCTPVDAGAVVDAGNVDAGTPYVSAGALTISGGSLSAPLVINPGADNLYNDFGATPIFSGGQSVTVAAAGATVPAFQISASSPGTLTFTAPTFDAGSTTFQKSQDLNVTWTGGGTGDVTASIASAAGGNTTQILCKFSASGGSGVVPAAALADLAANGTISIGAATTTTTKAGDYDVTYVLSGGSGASGMFTAN